MAETDVRISELTDTTTSAANDDYIALDGATYGTRKMLASNLVGPEASARAAGDEALDEKIGTLSNLTTTAKGSAVAAINEVDSHADNAQNTADTNAAAIGTLSSLTTDAKGSLVAAINEVDSHADGKVDKVNGKGLSTNDYTDAEKTKLSGIEAGAEVNDVTSVAGKTGAVTLAGGDVSYSDETTYADGTIGAAVSGLKSDLTTLNNGFIDLLSGAKYYDEYYNATPEYTGTGTEGMKTGWCVCLIHVKKGSKITIANMSAGGVNSAWLNSNDLDDIHSVFSSSTNDGTKVCLTDWLGLSVKNSLVNHDTYSVTYSYTGAISNIEKNIGRNNCSNMFELGNISISGTGWIYSDSTTRVRLIEGTTIHLPAGTKIGLSDYTSARYYVGWHTGSTYGFQGWLREDFTTSAEGDYVILITRVPEATEASANSLASLFFYDSVTVYGKVNQLEADVSGINANLSLINTISANNNVRSINHRGYNTIAPENTIPAFKLSKKKGFDWVETDVRWTSDGVPVLLHDETINRTARNADGTELENTVYIKNITYAEALEYDFGIRKGAEYAGTKIPKFEDFLSLCRNIGLKPYIEIKSSDVTTELVNGLIAISKKSGIAKHITYISDSDTVLSDIGLALENSGLGLVTGSINSSTITAVVALKPYSDYVFADSSHYTDAEVELCVNGGIGLEVWTINSSATILTLPDYISGVTSDSVNAGYELYKANIT